MTHRNTPPEAQVSKFPSVTVVGVILAFSQPCRTKTNQWMLSVSLVDQSIPVVDKDDEGIEKLIVMNVNIFRKYRQELPSLRKVGDLLRLHDAGIQVCQIGASHQCRCSLCMLSRLNWIGALRSFLFALCD